MASHVRLGLGVNGNLKVSIINATAFIIIAADVGVVVQMAAFNGLVGELICYRVFHS